jgi:hypothetical protein
MPSDFTPNTVWGSTTNRDEELTLPSGQTCLAHKVRLEDMLSTGMLGEVDALTGIVQRYVKKVGKGKAQKAASQDVDSRILSDPNAVDIMLKVADQVMPAIVVSPVVVCHFKNVTVGKTTVTKALTNEERKAYPAGTVFTDQIGLEDKFELFNWGLGGLDSFASFREGPTDDVGDVADVEGHGNSGKRTAGDS